MRLASVSAVKEAIPVIFPPGRDKDAATPILTGSATADITTGMVLVALFTVRISGVPEPQARQVEGRSVRIRELSGAHYAHRLIDTQ